METNQGQRDASDPSKEYAPQNGYRSYDKAGIYPTQPLINNDMVRSERISIAQNTVRANGGIESMDAIVDSTGQFQSDGR